MGYLDTVSAALGFSTDPLPPSNPNPNPSEKNMNFAPPPKASAQSTPPAGNSNPPAPAPKAPDPIDIFGKMFDNTPSTDAPPAFTLDPAQLSTVANGQDFLRGVDPELLNKANSGDSTAVMQVMQQVSRNTYQAALLHNSKLTESFVGAREGFTAKGLGTKIRGELTVNALTGTPNFQNPGVRKLLVNIAQTLEKDHPDASPEQIATMARQAVTEAAQAVNPNGGQPSEPQGKQPTDWDNFFDS